MNAIVYFNVYEKLGKFEKFKGLLYYKIWILLPYEDDSLFKSNCRIDTSRFQIYNNKVLLLTQRVLVHKTKLGHLDSNSHGLGHAEN